MKKLIFLILITLSLLYTSCSSSKSLACSKFKTGNFEMQVEGIEVFINRDEKIQTESFDTIQSKYNITWKDACNYRLELLGRSNLDVSQNIPIMDVKIYKVSGDTCFTLTTAPGLNFEDRSWMKKVK